MMMAGFVFLPMIHVVVVLLLLSSLPSSLFVHEIDAFMILPAHCTSNNNNNNNNNRGNSSISKRNRHRNRNVETTASTRTCSIYTRTSTVRMYHPLFNLQSIDASSSLLLSSSSPSLFSSSSSHEEDAEEKESNSSNIDTVMQLSELNDMDVVIYSLASSATDAAATDATAPEPELRLGAMEDGVFSPLSAWTDEYAFGTSIEFLVDDVDRFALKEIQITQQQQQQDQQNSTNNDTNTDNDASNNTNIRIHYLLSSEAETDEISYGARQCPRGVHNPHGEESELLYYIDYDTVIQKFQIELTLKPELEILW